MNVWFPDEIEPPVDPAFFLAMSPIDEVSKASPDDPHLPFWVRIAAPQPHPIKHQLPTAEKPDGFGGGLLHSSLQSPSECRSGNFVGIQKKDPGILEVTMLKRPISLISK